MKVLLSLFFCLSAQLHAEEVVADLRELPAKQSSRDVKIPVSLVKSIETQYREFRKLNHTSEIADNAPIVRHLLNAYVELTQKRQAALAEDMRIRAPIGGGVIDLQDFVTPLHGAFRARIVFEREGQLAPQNFHVFYISRAEKRSLDGESFGAGCGKYYDVTKYFSTQLNKNGVELFTKEQRYLSVLAGTFVMVSFENEGLYVGSLTFEDGRYPALQCEG